MAALARSLRLSPSRLAVLMTLALAACATAQDPDLNPDDFGNGPVVTGGGGAGGSAAGTGGKVVTGPTAGTTVVGTPGGSGSVPSGGKPSTGGTPGTGTAGTGISTAGTATTTGGTSATTCPPYTGTVAADSTTFKSGFGTSTTGTWSGYGFTYTYGTGAKIAPGMGDTCFSGAKFCANGTVPAADTAGAGLGWNIGQKMNSSTNTAVAVTTPVKVTLAGAVAGMRVQLSVSSAVSYCYTLTTTDVPTATVKLASFNTKCWDNSGTAYDGSPIQAIQVVVPGAATAAKTFDFCVLDIEPG
ncbi:MAG TPA: hypothetical protein VEQ59_09920 [Polyangiaceae bacterium]|nr:hypothetical protein [Polyangiaceae bacterium]